MSQKQKAAAAHLHEGGGRREELVEREGRFGPATLTGYASEAPIILLINMISQRTKKATAALAMPPAAAHVPCHLFRFSAFPQPFPLLPLLLALASFAFYANFTADEHSKRSKGQQRGVERGGQARDREAVEEPTLSLPLSQHKGEYVNAKSADVF